MEPSPRSSCDWELRSTRRVRDTPGLPECGLVSVDRDDRRNRNLHHRKNGSAMYSPSPLTRFPCGGPASLTCRRVSRIRAASAQRWRAAARSAGRPVRPAGCGPLLRATAARSSTHAAPRWSVRCCGAAADPLYRDRHLGASYSAGMVANSRSAEHATAGTIGTSARGPFRRHRREPSEAAHEKRTKTRCA